METQEKIVNRYVEKPVKTKNGFARGRLPYSRQRNEPVRRDYHAAQTGEGTG